MTGQEVTGGPSGATSAPRTARGRLGSRPALLVYAAGCLAGLGYFVSGYGNLIRGFPAASVVNLAGVLIVLAVGFPVLRRLRPVHAPPAGASMVAVVWGATAATGGAMMANQLVAVWGKAVSVDFASQWSAALTAPLNEEILKLAGVALLALSFPALVRGPVDGMIYGGLVGLGFQVTENFVYGTNQIFMTGATNPILAVVQTFFVRAGITGIASHWSMTAVAGAGLGCLVAYGRRGRGPFCGLLLTAAAMHFLLNTPYPQGFFPLIAKVLIIFATFVYVYRTVRGRYLRDVHAVLSAWSAAGFVTPQEAAALPTRAARRIALTIEAPAARPQAIQRYRTLLDRLDESLPVPYRP